MNECDVTMRIFEHSNRSDVLSVCDRYADSDDVILYPYRINRGASRSWNEGIRDGYASGADVVIVCNDDILFSSGDVDKVADRAIENRDVFLVTMAGWHSGFNVACPSHGYSCFAINPIAIETVGYFDVNIFPAYLEDCDYSYRAVVLSGLQQTNVADTMVFHVGSYVIKNDEAISAQNAHTHGLNFQYYDRKWGGINGQEVFMTPFNDKQYDACIPEERMEAPYGEYDRTDFEEVVKI